MAGGVYGVYGIADILALCSLSLYISLRTSSVKKAVEYTALTLILWHTVSNVLFWQIVQWVYGPYPVDNAITILHLVWGIGYAICVYVLVRLTVLHLRYVF
jgi:hypothetical protein